ncbi:SMC-Scp complex subunit ScpB [Candidatus Woesearchaeota archaeon]|nr:SMC-Scp complex subunit ScpB [Candidatus Woesearchaeota archaeon]
MEDWKKIEALLFASGKYITEEQLITLSKIPKNKIKKALTDLKNKYEENNTSLTIYNEADAWKLNVKEEYTEIIKEVVSDAEMPRAVMETLAIIAYKSPVLQSEIKDIRGTTSYDHIALLEAKGFINRERQGRSYKIRLTTKFHEYFDIDGDSKLAELFKDVKKPEKLGNLEVYEEKDEKEDKEFDDKITERMKKLEKTNEDEEQENNFLNEFEEKFEKTKQKIDESEQDIQSFRKRTDEDTEQIFKEKQEQEEETIGTTKSKQIFEENQEDEEQQENQEDKEENEETGPEFLKKINQQIDDLIGTNTEQQNEENEEQENAKENDIVKENQEDEDQHKKIK